MTKQIKKKVNSPGSNKMAWYNIAVVATAMVDREGPAKWPYKWWVKNGNATIDDLVTLSAKSPTQNIFQLNCEI